MQTFTNDKKDFFWGAIAGGAVATLTALLFTTRKGKQIQGKICSIYDDVEDTVKNAISDTKEAVSDSKEKLEDAAEHAEKKAAQKLHK